MRLTAKLTLWAITLGSFALIGAGVVQAHTFNWQPPTEYVSGAPLDPDVDLQEFRVYCDGGEDPVTIFPAPSTTGSHPFAPGSSHTCTMTAVDLAGDESPQSNAVNFTEPASRPRAPVLEDGGAG